MTDKLSINGNLQARFRDNSTQMYRNIGEIGLRYRFGGLYSLGGSYRISDWGFTNTQRLDIDNFFNHKINKERIGLRIKFTQKFGFNTSLESRLRFRIGYKHVFSKRMNLFVRAEYFYTNNFRYSNWDKQRYTVGTKFRLALKNFVTVFGRYEFEQNVENPFQRYIIGVAYNFEK